MDKKNTMLLTVIAVATLLVAVVGATFAYFAISTDEGASSKTTITGSTPEAVTSAVALTGNEELYLKLTAENMAQANHDHYFYATSTNTDAEEETSSSNPGAHKVTVGTAKLVGGEAGATYQCTANYKITVLKSAGDVSSENISDIAFDEADEAKLFLYGEDTSVNVTALDSGDGIKLSEIIAAGEDGKTGNVTFNLTGGSTSEKKLQAALQIKNANKPRQEDLAGKTFVVRLEATEFTCTPVKAD